MEEQTMTEIAADLGVAVSTVSRTLKRAKERLHKCLRYGAAELLYESEKL
jgi:DNA-directed RNA polymerase specialized sigma24 family protein